MRARGNKWNKGAKGYVERSLDQCDTNEQLDAMYHRVRKIVCRAKFIGELQETDWDSFPLPQVPQSSGQGNKQPGRGRGRGKKGGNRWNSGPTESDASESSGSTASSTTGRRFNNFNDFNPVGKGKKPISGFNVEELKSQTKKNDRAARFKAEEETKAPSKAIFEEITTRKDLSQEEIPKIVGTCETIEKEYFRLTRQAHHSEVRPLRVLRRALKLQKENYKLGVAYAKICSQMKSLRQDLTLQRIKNAFTIKVYEFHARIALRYDDYSEFNQCVSMLMIFYEEGIHDRKEARLEFKGYKLLYTFAHGLQTEVAKCLMTLTDKDIATKWIQQVVKIITLSNDGRLLCFFKTYTALPKMMKLIMNQNIDSFRFRALNVITTTYLDLELDYLQLRLGFEDNQALVQFLDEHSLQYQEKFPCKPNRERVQQLVH